MACDCGKSGTKPVTPLGKWGNSSNNSSNKQLTVKINKSAKSTRVIVGKRK